MSEVILNIDGRAYTVACEEGQESHIKTLGGMIEEKLASMGQLTPSRSQNLLFAGLFLADDLYEANKTGGTATQVQSELETLRSAKSEMANALQEVQLERDALLSERDTMRADHASLQNELVTAKAKLEESNRQLTKTTERMAQANVQIAQLETQKAAANRGPNLAPELVELAEALEKCATKLEERVPDA